MNAYKRRKEFQKIALNCDFYHHGICISSPCWCRKELKESIKKQALETLNIIYEKSTIPHISEIQDYFFGKGDRNISYPFQFCAYYNCIGWPKNWKKEAWRFLNKQ